MTEAPTSSTLLTIMGNHQIIASFENLLITAIAKPIGRIKPNKRNATSIANEFERFIVINLVAKTIQPSRIVVCVDCADTFNNAEPTGATGACDRPKRLHTTSC